MKERFSLKWQSTITNLNEHFTSNLEIVISGKFALGENIGKGWNSWVQVENFYEYEKKTLGYSVDVEVIVESDVYFSSNSVNFTYPDENFTNRTYGRFRRTNMDEIP